MVNNLNYLMPYRWKQKGSQPIPLIVYDTTKHVKWSAIVQEAVALWNQSRVFELTYQKVDSAPVPTNRIAVVEVYTDESSTKAVVVPDRRGYVQWANIILNTKYLPEDTVWIWEDIVWIWHKHIRHELGHALGLDHTDQFTDIGSVMAIGTGIEITQFDLDLLEGVYRLR